MSIENQFFCWENYSYATAHKSMLILCTKTAFYLLDRTSASNLQLNFGKPILSCFKRKSDSILASTAHCLEASTRFRWTLVKSFPISIESNIFISTILWSRDVSLEGCHICGELDHKRKDCSRRNTNDCDESINRSQQQIGCNKWVLLYFIVVAIARCHHSKVQLSTAWKCWSIPCHSYNH